MMQQLRQRALVLASTNHPFAVAVGSVLGFLGVLRRRRGSIDHVKSTVSLGKEVRGGVRAADEHHDRADQRLQP